MGVRIVPTLIAENQEELEMRFNKVEKYTSWLQIDVMDGKFVENKSNWFDFKLPRTHKYEAHLMVDGPMQWVKKNCAKVDVIIANIERLSDVNSFVEFLDNKKMKKGIALNPETSLKTVIPYLKYLDRVLILSANPGRYGAPFIPKTVKKIEELRRLFKGEIEVDCCQNPITIPKSVGAGANVIAVGSYIQNSSDPKTTIKSLKELVRGIEKNNIRC